VDKKAIVDTMGRNFLVEIKAETNKMIFVRYVGYSSDWNEWLPKTTLLESQPRSVRHRHVKELAESDPVWRHCFGVVGRGAELGPNGRTDVPVLAD